MYRLPKASKLEPRALEMRVVGYAGAGYRLWNTENNSIIISRDVTFDEHDFDFRKVKRVTQMEENEEESINHATESEDFEIEEN